MGDRIKVNEKQLASAIAGWLRHVPKRIWDQFIEHKILQHYKRSSLQAQRLEGEIADHVASEMTRLDWEVTHPKNGNIFSDELRHSGQMCDDHRQHD
jgi:hypothetical protein